MPSNRGRPRKRTREFFVRLPEHVLTLLVVHRPELFRPGEPGVFKYGAWSEYILSLIIRDIRQRSDRPEET